MQSALLLTSDLLHCMGRDKRLTSLPILLYMVLPHLMKILASCPPSIWTTYWGEPFFFLLKRMGSAIEPALLHMSPILKIPKLHEKISRTYTYEFKTRMILKSSFHTISSWTSWNSIQKLKSLLMAISSSGE